LDKNDKYYNNHKEYAFPFENSEINTNYEKSNTSNNENYTNFNISNNIQQDNLDEKILRVKTILSNLKKSQEVNYQLQKLLMHRYEKLNDKQLTIEKTLEKIKRINKSKQKKHIKYLKYTPLNKVYYYCPKKIHYYYILMDLVIKSRKKNKLINNNFHFSLGGNNSNVSKKKDINRFKFTKKEDSILKKNLLFVISEENLDWGEIAKEVQTKNAFQVFVRSLELSNFYAYKKWNTIEDNILRKAILYYGPKNWQQISYCLDGRNNSQCFHRWMKGINPKIKRNKWSFEEDLTLGVALKIYGNKKWSKIANHLNGRTDIQCRERFCNILDPNLEEVEWKNAEDLKLLSLYERYGNKWSKIAKEFGNRTDNTCWRRWKYLISVRNLESYGTCNNSSRLNTSLNTYGNANIISLSNASQNANYNSNLVCGNTQNILKDSDLNYSYNYSYMRNDIENSKSEKKNGKFNNRKYKKNKLLSDINKDQIINIPICDQERVNEEEINKFSLVNHGEVLNEKEEEDHEIIKNLVENGTNKNKLFTTSVDKSLQLNNNAINYLGNSIFQSSKVIDHSSITLIKDKSSNKFTNPKMNYLKKNSKNKSIRKKIKRNKIMKKEYKEQHFNDEIVEISNKKDDYSRIINDSKLEKNDEENQNTTKFRNRVKLNKIDILLIF